MPAILFMAALVFAIPGYAQESDGAEIIQDKALDKADVATLQAEADLLETIRKGIALSIAVCESDKSCSPAVNRDELHRIIDKVAKRIDVLTARHSETNDVALEPVMLAYADVRDNFTTLLEQLKTLVPEESVFGEKTTAGLPKDFADVFKDADQTLGDDEDGGTDSFKSSSPQ